MLNLATPLRYWSHTFYSRTLGGLAGGKARNNPEFVARHGEERMRHKPSMQGYTGQMIGAAAWSTLPSLQTIIAPTLIVMGDDDPLVPPANGALLAERISEARLLVAPGEGHLLLMDPESAVLEPIREFLGTRNLGSAPIWRELDVPQKVTRPRIAVDISVLYRSIINACLLAN
jgi:pimeloyl-ACP methyl ester carboxylesterase